ncbi:fructose-6-phosphate aldolase [archaeon]|nr:fructose-6-phosphate aldolase [archaeon]
MKIFLDTGNIEEVRKAAEIGILDGVTTNPSLIAKEGKPFVSTLKEIIRILTTHNRDAIINGEVINTTSEGMIEEAYQIAKIHRNMVVKIPLIPEGIKAVSYLSKKKIRTNVTLCFSSAQALLAAKAGAFIVSPFLGRLDDAGHDGIELIKQIRKIYDNYGFKTQILAASIRSPLQVVRAAEAGADIATMPYDVFEKLFKHPLTDAGLEKFLSDWHKYQEKEKTQ